MPLVKRHEVTQPSDQSYRLIPLTCNQNAIVDTEDFLFLSQWNWAAHWSSATKSFYADRWVGKGVHLKMHRAVMNAGPGTVVDHINRNTLDNRKLNLRLCNRLGNARNSGLRSDNKSGYKGVTLRPDGTSWRVRINVNGTSVYIGQFPIDMVKEAARAYDEAAKYYHGEFAFLNFPPD